MCLGCTLQTQGVAQIDTLSGNQDTTIITLDTTVIDSEKGGIVTDTFPKSVPIKQKQGYKISPNAVESQIQYGSTDSSYLDLKENQVHLFGDAFVKYQKYDLKAAYIIFDFDDNLASAFTLRDSTGKVFGKPDFTDGSNTFVSDGLKYNFSSNKGLILGAKTAQSEYTIHGQRTKFIAGANNPNSEDDIINNRNAIITTCTADHPHFGIRTSKLKLIPDKLAVLGFSNIEIMGIPTPLILPFGAIPLVQGRSTGLIFPSNYEYDDDLGLGFRNIGYYFPINDYFDLTVTGDIYTRGTHRINLNSKYNKRYQYNGNVTLSYANNYGESTVDGSRLSNKSYKLVLRHNQDPKAHPYRSINGSINIQTNRFDQVNSNEFEDVVNNKLQSQLNYRHSMPGTPFTFTAGMSHQQDTRTRRINITLPQATLRMQTIYPFKKGASAQASWYENINFSYDAEIKNTVDATDTTLFTQEALDNLQSGFNHELRTGTNYNLLKYINLSANARFEQTYFTRLQRRSLDPDFLLDTVSTSFDQDSFPIYEIDTTFGTINTFYENDLAVFNQFNVNVNLATNLFATKRFSKGWLRGIRHTMKPSIGFAYMPGTRDRYQEEVLASSAPNETRFIQYNPYTGGAFNTSLSDQSMSMTYRIENLFEGKYYSKKDSSEKKFKILRSLNLSGFYNFAADSLKWSPLRITGNTTLFNFTNINFNATYDFYERNENGQLINQSVWSTRRRPVAFNNFRVQFTSGVSIREIRSLFTKKKGLNEDIVPIKQGETSRPRQKQGTLGDFIDDFQIDHALTYSVNRMNNGRDTSFISNHSIRVHGTIPLTPNWSMSVRNISYDFVNNRFVYPQFSLDRDLHCWTMQFTWAPSNNVYSFFIGVKSNSISFLKYNYGQRNPRQLLGQFPR